MTADKTNPFTGFAELDLALLDMALRRLLVTKQNDLQTVNADLPAGATPKTEHDFSIDRINELIALNEAK